MTYPEDENLPEISQTFLNTLDDAATPRQQALAVQINRRLMAGESVEDVRDLIDRMAAVITEEQRERQASPKIGNDEPDEPTVLTEDSW